MAVIINSVGNDKFTSNGKTYSRIFQPLAAGLTHVALYNTFDTRLQIVGPTHYSEYVVNGISYMNQTTLIQGLLNVVYVTTSGGGGGGGGAWGDITGTLSNQGDLWSALGGKSNVGHTHTFASITSKPTTIAGYGITNALKNTTDTLTGNLTVTGNITATSRLYGGKGMIKTYNQNADLAQFVHRDLDTNYTQYGMLMSSTGTMYYGATAHNFTAGNVGIGVENPYEKLTVGGDNNYIASQSTAYKWGDSQTIGVKMGTDSVGGLIDFRRWSGGGTSHYTAGVKTSNYGGNYGLDFLTSFESTNKASAQSRMFINMVGDVGIGKTNPSVKLDVAGKIRAASDITAEGFLEVKAAYPQINFNNNVDTRLMYRVDNELRFRFDGTNDGTLWHSGNSFTKSGSNYSFGGNITATSFFESSDKRLKTNIEPISDTFRTFELKSEEGKRYGVIAQEIEETNPELVRTDDKGMKSVNYIDLLVMKMAEQENKIARLEAMVEQLINKG